MNKSNRNHFDPSPVTPSCFFSHELFNTLLAISTQLRNAWSTLCKKTHVIGTAPTRDESSNPRGTNALDSIVTVFAQGKSSDPTMFQNPQWLVPPADLFQGHSKSSNHSYDLYRAYTCDSVMEKLHMDDEPLAVPRDW